MYCLILYGDPPERHLSAPPNTAESSVQILEREDEKILYVNPECAAKILIDYIKNELQILPSENIDLCTLAGDLICLDELEPFSYATNVMEPYATYICVLKYTSEAGILSKLTPLVSKSYSEISVKLRKYVMIPRRLSHDIKYRIGNKYHTDSAMRSLAKSRPNSIISHRTHSSIQKRY